MTYTLTQSVHKLKTLSMEDKIILLIKNYAFVFMRNGSESLYDIGIPSARKIWDELQILEFDYR